MSDVQLLFVVVVALYIWECACWLRRHGLAFASWLGRRWRALPPGGLIANQNGGFVFAPPLPPLGTIFVTHQFPLSFSPEAVLGFVATNVNPGWRPAQTGKLFRLDGIRETRVHGRKLLINGETLATFASPALARHAGNLLQQLLKLNPAERTATLARFYRANLDARSAETRCREFQTRARAVRLLANFLFAYVLLLIPAVVWIVGIKLSWLGLLLGLLALTTATAVCFRRAHRALYPEAADERFTHTLTILLAPTTAMRAVDALSRPLLEGFHPLAAAKVLLSQEDFHQMARRLWLDLQHPALPQTPSPDPAITGAELLSRRAWQEAVSHFLQSNGMNPDQLAQPPAPNDDTCRAYCPRCLAQFTAAAENCPDCGGLPLLAFKSAA